MINTGDGLHLFEGIDLIVLIFISLFDRDRRNGQARHSAPLTSQRTKTACWPAAGPPGVNGSSPIEGAHRAAVRAEPRIAAVAASAAVEDDKSVSVVAQRQQFATVGAEGKRTISVASPDSSVSHQ